MKPDTKDGLLFAALMLGLAVAAVIFIVFCFSCCV